MSLTLKEYPPELNQHVEPYRKAHGQDPKWPEFEDDLIRKWCVDNHRPDIIITDSGPDTPIAPTTKQPETKPLGIPYEQGQIPQPFTAEPSTTGISQNQGKDDLQRLGEAVPKSFMNASAKLGATAIRLAPTAIASIINPAGGLLVHFTKEGKAVQAIADKEANKVVDYWKPDEKELQRLSEAGIPEKVAFGIADFIGQYPQFMVAGALGGGVVANLAKSLGVDAKVILQALPTVKKLIGAKKTVELASAVPGNIIGFGTKGTAETYGETGSAKKAVEAGAKEATIMGALPLNRLVTKALQPLTAAGAGFGLGMAQTGDVKEATTQGLMFLAMELPGMIKPEHRPIIEKAQKEPTTENKTEAVKIIEKDYQATTPEQKQELNKGLTPEHKKLIDDLVAEKEALAAENVQLKADVVTDPLTQVKNRRGLEAVREGKTQSIIFDLDHFKKINDQHGHPVGDGVLQEVVTRTVPIAEKVGGEIGRIGGEEFVVLLPEGVDRAKVSEEIRTAIESAPANIYGKDIPFTVSVGHAKADATGDPWKTADKYLYEAKNSGRNKVMGEPTTEKAPAKAKTPSQPAKPVKAIEINDAIRAAGNIVAGTTDRKTFGANNEIDKYIEKLKPFKKDLVFAYAYLKHTSSVDRVLEDMLAKEEAAPPKAPAKAKTDREVQAERGQTEIGKSSFVSQAVEAGVDPEVAEATRILGEAFAKATGISVDKVLPQITTEAPGAGMLAQREAQAAEPFYSKLRKVIADKMPNSATIEAINGLIAGAGVKNDELTWSGVKDFLEGKDKVSKTELLDYLDKNQVEVKEVVKGDDGDVAAWWNDEGGANEEKPYDELTAPERREALQRYRDEVGDYQDDATKFSQYQLPGGESYREVLVTMPLKTGYKLESLENGNFDLYANGKLIKSNIDAKEASEIQPSQRFTSSHFSEPNILYHLRLNDRTTADGKKMLFAEEIQSDWHQAGRERGYKGGMPEGLAAFQNKQGWYIGDKETKGFLSGAMGKTPEEALAMYWKNYGVGGQVPPAPFSKTWHEQAIKRMLRYAAENGYDGIGWTTGEQQAERYDLSKQVDVVSWTSWPNAGKDMGLLTASKDGVSLVKEKTTLANVAAYIGKDAARKLQEQKADPLTGMMSIEGDNLKVGGEGMKGFYDKMLVDFGNKYTKKWGSGVEDKQIPTTDQSGIDLEDYETLQADDGTWGVYHIGGSEVIEGLKSEAEALKHIQENIGDESIISVHYLPITDAMRSDVVYKGQELFQKAGPAIQGAITFDAGKALIHVLKTANASTLPHELAHNFLKLGTEARYFNDTEIKAMTDFGVLDKNGATTQPGQEKFARSFERYLRDGQSPSEQLKAIFDKFKAWLQEVYAQLQGSAIDIKLTPEIKRIFDRMLGKVERGQTELGIKTLDAIMSNAKEKQIINDTVRKLGPEKAFEKLRQDGYNITLDEMKQLGSQVMGGAKPRREAYAIINDTFSKNFDKDASIKTAAEEANAGIGIKQTEGQLKDITDRWIRANGRELNTEVSEMMNAIKVNPEFIKEFISRNKPDDFNQADLTLHHNETEQMLSEHNLTAQDLNRIGKDGTEWLLKSAKLTEITNRTAIAAKELMARSLDKSLPDGERAAYEVQARQMMTAVWNLAQKDVLTARQTGRALEYRKQGKNVDAQNIISSINEAMREPGVNLSRAQIQELFTKIAGLKTGQPLLSAIRKTTFGNWFWHWYYSSILSGPRTHFKNIGDTFINGVVEQLTNVIIDPESAGSVLKEYSLGFGKGLGTAIKETGRAFALKPINPAIVEVHQKFEQAQQTGPVGNVAWKILDIPGRIMSAWDLGNQMPTKAAAVSSITKGRMPTEFELIQAAHESRRAAYNNEPEGWVGIIADHVGQVTNRVRPAKFIVPFTRIVANVFNSGLDYTPLGIKRAFEYKTDSPEWRQKQNQQRFGTDKSPYAQRDFQKQLARVAIGTTAMGLMAALGKDRISGSGPQDYNKKDELKKTGWQEYSVKIGDKWISYQNLGSFSLPLSIVGNYLDAHKYKNMEEDNIIDRTSYALMGIGRTMMDKSFLSGASTLMQGIERQDKKYLQRIATQPITAINPNIIKQISDLFDPNIKAPQTTAQRIIRSFRPLGQSGVPNRIDIFGRPVTKTALERASGFLGLSMIEAKGTEPVLEALIKQGVFLSGVKQVNINKGDANEKELKGNDLVEYRKIRGQLVRKYLDLSAEEIYANADDKDELFKIAGRITDRATREAKIQFGQRVKPKKFNPNATPGPPTPKIRF